MQINDDQELSLIGDSKYEDSFSDIEEIGETYVNIESEGSLSLSLKPILRTIPKESTKKLRWVDELDDPQPLHEERETPRWIKSSSQNSFCMPQVFKIWATIFVIISVLLITLIFTVRFFFYDSSQPITSAPVRNLTASFQQLAT